MYIKIKMYMPRNCDECILGRLVYKDMYICQPTGKVINYYKKKAKYRRHPKCPLKEVKE